MRTTHVMCAATVALLVFGACQSPPSPPGEPPAASDTEQESTPIETRVLSSDPELTCEAAAAKVAEYATKEPATRGEVLELAAATTRRLSCILSEHNKNAETDQKLVAVGNVSEDSFELEVVAADEGDLAEYEAACKALSAGVAEFGVETAAFDAGSALLVGAYGAGVACPAYIDAAANADPLLIVAPDFVVARHVTKKVLQEIELYDDAKEAGQSVEEFIKNEPKKVAVILGNPALGAAVEVIDKNKEKAKKTGQDGIDILRGKKKLW